MLAAAAADVAPIETVYPAFRDLEGLAAYAARGRRDGFTGMMAIHPDQVAVINRAFTPGDDELAHARKVIEAFEANPGVGALPLEGRMLDGPHRKQRKGLWGLRRGGNGSPRRPEGGRGGEGGVMQVGIGVRVELNKKKTDT